MCAMSLLLTLTEMSHPVKMMCALLVPLVLCDWLTLQMFTGTKSLLSLCSAERQREERFHSDGRGGVQGRGRD